MDPEISSPVKTAERVLAALAPKRRVHLEGGYTEARTA
jgi:hypothetical protein